MAVAKTNTKYAVKVTYKTDFDTLNEFPSLGNYTQTFSSVREDATVDQLKAFADALMSLTIYRDAPYVVSLVDTAELVVE